jgi:TetR/AcrR family tetracycline transcriptional repressor
LSAPAPVTRQRVIDTALRMVEEDGVGRLSMRKLAAELGVAVTAIYWHVGNREALLDALVQRELEDASAIRVGGASAESRLLSIARGLRRKLLARPHLIGLVKERGLTPRMFLPAQLALARQLADAGMGEADAVMAIRALQFHVIGSVVVQRWSDRSPTQHAPVEAGWRQLAASAGMDPMVAERLAQRPDPDDLFEFSTRKLISALLAPASSARPR